VGVGEIGCKRQGALRRLAGINPRVFRRRRTVPERDIALRQASVGVRIAGVSIDSILEKASPPLELPPSSTFLRWMPDAR
jgi:hypothetical protein